jgi:hypothetical protein
MRTPFRAEKFEESCIVLMFLFYSVTNRLCGYHSTVRPFAQALIRSSAFPYFSPSIQLHTKARSFLQAGYLYVFGHFSAFFMTVLFCYCQVRHFMISYRHKQKKQNQYKG